MQIYQDCDNGYSPDIISYHLICPKCEKQWAIDQSELINLADKRLYDDKLNALRETEQRFVGAVNSAIDSSIHLASIQEEFRFLEPLGILSCGRNLYYKARRNKSPISSLCSVLYDNRFVRIVTQYFPSSDLNQLIEICRTMQLNCDSAYKSIQRIKFSELEKA